MPLDSNNDNVYIEIFRFGGSDDLNMFVPTEQLGRYYELRPTIGIPQNRLTTLDTTLGAGKVTGLHPAIATAFKAMWDRGEAAILPATQYNGLINLSHATSRDINARGDDRSEFLNSGIIGRYLSLYNPTHNEPEGIAIGNIMPLHFHPGVGLPEAITIGQGGGIQNVVTNNGLVIPATFGTSKRQKRFAQKAQTLLDADRYSSVVKNIFDNAPPFNPLVNNSASFRLATIGRLLLGGSKTRTFTVIVGGFDTHANQVQAGSPWLGTHANSMGTIMEGINDFLIKLKAASPELYNKVLIGVTTEFGRRPFENTSLGTDHGTSKPVLMFGAGVKPGFYGTHASLEESSFIQFSGNPPAGNLEVKQNYLKFYYETFGEHMGVSGADLDFVVPENTNITPRQPVQPLADWYEKPVDVNPPTVPVTPSVLTATADSESQITVSYNAVSGATTYELQARTAGNAFSTVQNNSNTSFVHVGLTASTAHDYRVRAVNSAGASAYSAIVSAITDDSQPPVTATSGVFSFGASEQGGVNQMFGQPHLTKLTYVDSATGIGINTIKTANWIVDDATGVSASDTLGTPGGSNAVFSEAQRRSGFLNRNTNGFAKDQFEFTGLAPGEEYEVTVFGSNDARATAPIDYRLLGGSPQQLHRLETGKNQSNNVVITQRADSNGRMYMQASLTNNVTAVINAIHVKKKSNVESGGYPATYPQAYP